MLDFVAGVDPVWTVSVKEMESEMAGMSTTEATRIGEAVRGACVKTALEAYEQARMDGLCDEGALEVALDAVRGLNVARLVAELTRERDEP